MSEVLTVSEVLDLARKAADQRRDDEIDRANYARAMRKSL